MHANYSINLAQKVWNERINKKQNKQEYNTNLLKISHEMHQILRKYRD